MKSHHCRHRDDNNRSTFSETASWNVGRRRIIEEQCSKCGRVTRSEPPKGESLLSGRRGVRKATA